MLVLSVGLLAIGFAVTSLSCAQKGSEDDSLDQTE
jgi:hypothetical protein